MIRLVGVVFVVAAGLAAWFWLGRGTAPVPETAFQGLRAPHAAAPVVPTVSPQVPQPAPPRDLVSPEPVVRQATAEPLDMEERRSLVAVKREQIRDLMAQLPAVRFDDDAREALNGQIKEHMEEYDRLVLPVAVLEVQTGNEAGR